MCFMIELWIVIKGRYQNSATKTKINRLLTSKFREKRNNGMLNDVS